MTRIRSSVQLKLEHNIEQHVPSEFDDKEREKEEKRKRKKEREREKEREIDR